MTVSRQLSAVWALFAFSLLAASGVLIAFSIIWNMPNMITQFIVDGGFLKAGLGLGITYGITVFAAVIAIVQPNHVTIFLAGLNWMLLVDAIATLVIGSVIWFFTLRERAEYGAKWLVTSEGVRSAVQNEFKCCGYMFVNESNIPQDGFCTADILALNTTVPCVGPITSHADYTLNNIFTSVYGFMAVIVGLFLASVCVINKRNEAERFRKIDAKRGGKGFV